MTKISSPLSRLEISKRHFLEFDLVEELENDEGTAQSLPEMVPESGRFDIHRILSEHLKSCRSFCRCQAFRAKISFHNEQSGARQHLIQSQKARVASYLHEISKISSNPVGLGLQLGERLRPSNITVDQRFIAVESTLSLRD